MKKILMLLLIPLLLLSFGSNLVFSKASWYGGKFHGKKTASGKVYDMHELTAAHKTLKFGTLVEVTNLSNDKKVIVEITDRGPFIRNRDIDLSKEAFKQISNLDKGVIDISYKIL